MTSATTKAQNGSSGGGISHDNVVDGNVVEDERTRSSDDECASTETKEKERDKEKKVTFQLQTQSLQRKRQHHKLLQLQQRLWVDKHAPTSISHILSDERTNREVLRALRAWDPYVFRREAPARPTPAYPSKYGQHDSKKYGRRGAFGKHGKNDHPLKRDTKDNGDDNNFDGTFNNQRTDARPDESSLVILLSGPPGVGKSTFPERLTSRLRAVLAAERMSVVAGGMLLRRLVAGTGGDIRSCLYALQFASARAREVATKKRGREGGADNESITVDISSALMATLGDNGNGMKDMQSDVSSTVAIVFRKDKVPSSRAAVNQKTNDRRHPMDLYLVRSMGRRVWISFSRLSNTLATTPKHWIAFS